MLQSRDLIIGGEFHRHHINAPPLRGIIASLKIGVGQGNQLLPLRKGDRFLRGAEAGASLGANLNKYKTIALLCDYVNFALAAAEVPSKYFVATLP
jgi:hypothetical protein